MGTVLIVDDDPSARETLIAMLESENYRLEIAKDGFQALQMIDYLQPDLILLDVMMPGMDGYETCRRIRQHAVGKRAFIVAITGWGQDGDKLRATDAGFDAHLTKPADPAALARLLAEAPRTPI